MATPLVSSSTLLRLSVEICNMIYREIVTSQTLQISIQQEENTAWALKPKSRNEIRAKYERYYQPSKCHHAQIRDRSTMLRLCRQIHDKILLLPPGLATKIVLLTRLLNYTHDCCGWERTVGHIAGTSTLYFIIRQEVS